MARRSMRPGQLRLQTNAANTPVGIFRTINLHKALYTPLLIMTTAEYSLVRLNTRVFLCMLTQSVRFGDFHIQTSEEQKRLAMNLHQITSRWPVATSLRSERRTALQDGQI